MIDTKKAQGFLRKIDYYEPGDIIPNIEIYEGKYLYDFINNYLFIFILTTTCKACLNSLEGISNIVDKYKSMNFLLLVHTSNKNIEILKDIFGKSRVHYIKLSTIHRELNVNAYPWGIGLNGKGQIITSSACSTKKSLYHVIEPFYFLLGWEL